MKNIFSGMRRCAVWFEFIHISEKVLRPSSCYTGRKFIRNEGKFITDDTAPHPRKHIRHGLIFPLFRYSDPVSHKGILLSSFAQQLTRIWCLPGSPAIGYIFKSFPSFPLISSKWQSSSQIPSFSILPLKQPARLKLISIKLHAVNLKPTVFHTVGLSGYQNSVATLSSHYFLPF